MRALHGSCRPMHPVREVPPHVADDEELAVSTWNQCAGTRTLSPVTRGSGPSRPRRRGPARSRHHPDRVDLPRTPRRRCPHLWAPSAGRTEHARVEPGHRQRAAHGAAGVPARRERARPGGRASRLRLRRQRPSPPPRRVDLLTSWQACDGGAFRSNAGVLVRMPWTHPMQRPSGEQGRQDGAGDLPAERGRDGVPDDRRERAAGRCAPEREVVREPL